MYNKVRSINREGEEWEQVKSEIDAQIEQCKGQLRSSSTSINKKLEVENFLAQFIFLSERVIALDEENPPTVKISERVQSPFQSRMLTLMLINLQPDVDLARFFEEIKGSVLRELSFYVNRLQRIGASVILAYFRQSPLQCYTSNTFFESTVELEAWWQTEVVDLFSERIPERISDLWFMKVCIRKPPTTGVALNVNLTWNKK